MANIQYPVTLFSVPHLLFMAVLLPAALLSAFYLSKKCGFTKKIIWICAIIGLLCELERMLFFIEETAGGFRLPGDFLPFNLCPFQVILIFILAF